jgi:hypothetical protein
MERETRINLATSAWEAGILIVSPTLAVETPFYAARLQIGL